MAGLVPVINVLQQGRTKSMPNESKTNAGGGRYIVIVENLIQSAEQYDVVGRDGPGHDEDERVAKSPQ